MLNDLVLEVTSHPTDPDGSYRIVVRDPWDAYRRLIIRAIQAWNSQERWPSRWEIVVDGPSFEYRFEGRYTAVEIARLIVALTSRSRGEEPRLTAPKHVRRQILLILNPQIRVVTGPDELVRRRARRSAG